MSDVTEPEAITGVVIEDGQADLQTMLQDDFVVELTGTVVNPPSVAEILTNLRTALETKQPYQLSPGEVRVLADYLEEKS